LTSSLLTRKAFIEKWETSLEDVKKNADQLRMEIQSAASPGRFHEFLPFSRQSAGFIRDILLAAVIVKRIIEETQFILDGAGEIGRT
jgi:enoyl-[acyl-carrier protein] reductase II